MIIEGKHAEVGQGIFVSDIQEGSNAEKVKECGNLWNLSVTIQFVLGRSEHWRHAASRKQGLVAGVQL